MLPKDRIDTTGRQQLSWIDPEKVDVSKIQLDGRKLVDILKEKRKKVGIIVVKDIEIYV